MIIGESDGAVNVLCLSSPNWQFRAASSPQISEKEEPRPCLQAAPHCLFVIFKQIKRKLICLLGNEVAAKWPGSPTGFRGEHHPLAMIASIVNNQGTNYSPCGIALTSR